MLDHMKDLELNVNCALGYAPHVDKKGNYKTGSIVVERFSTGWAVYRVRDPSGNRTRLYTGNSTTIATLLRGMKYGAHIASTNKENVA